MHTVTAKRYGDSVVFYVNEDPEGDTKNALAKAKTEANNIFGYTGGAGAPTVSVKPVIEKED